MLLAEEEVTSFPLNSAALLTDIYMDDILSCADSLSAAIAKPDEVS